MVWEGEERCEGIKATAAAALTLSFSFASAQSALKFQSQKGSNFRTWHGWNLSLKSDHIKHKKGFFVVVIVVTAKMYDTRKKFN
jgi:hypothetical protein